VQVHEVVDHTTLQIVLDPIDDDLLANIHDLQVGQIVLLLVDGLVNLLVIANALSKVLDSRLGILTLVIGGCSLDFEDVAHDDVLVVALRLDEESLYALCITSFLDPASACLCRVRSIEDPNDASLCEPLQHVRHSSFGSRSAHPLTLRVALVKEVGSGLRGVLASVIAHIEDHRIDGEPFQVALGCGGARSQSKVCEAAEAKQRGSCIPFCAIKDFPRAGRPTMTTQI